MDQDEYEIAQDAHLRRGREVVKDAEAKLEAAIIDLGDCVQIKKQLLTVATIASTVSAVLAVVILIIVLSSHT